MNGHSRSASQRSGLDVLDVRDDLTDERDRLAARLWDIRHQRLADETQAGDLPKLLRAIVHTRRDRDSGMSRRLRSHRAHLERVFVDAEDLVLATIEVNLLIHARGLVAADPVVHDANEAVRRGADAVDRLNRDLMQALS